MIETAMLDKFILNDEIISTNKFESIYKPVDPACYDVVRIIRGKPLFFDEHYVRFAKTITGTDQTIPYSIEEIAYKFRQLISINKVDNYNIKLIYNDFTNGGSMFIFFTPTFYPTDKMFTEGVPVDLMRFERVNPHSKIINIPFRENADAFITERNLFEAILINSRGEITEGSRSNVFFIRGGTLHTCPEEGVLQGVTRKHILGIAKEIGMNIIEEPIMLPDLPEFESAFLSGTSPKVLPIKTLGNITYDVNSIDLHTIMKSYEQEIAKDVEGWIWK